MTRPPEEKLVLRGTENALQTTFLQIFSVDVSLGLPLLLGQPKLQKMWGQRAKAYVVRQSQSIQVFWYRTYAQHLNHWGTAEGVNPLGPLEIL
jgi:hypothetical protein